MTSGPESRPIRPGKICLEASTACQLKCPSCPTASGETGKRLGVGFLKFTAFKRIVDENPWISAVELSNWGEIFLNKDLVKILEYAYRKNVALSAENGANLNHLPESVAEALVRFRFRSITCSIDGASQETYPIYRVNGDFQQVIDHIKTINRYKARYRSEYPRLLWQFVAFGHNEHEIETARSMARDLDMGFYVKLSWDDLYRETFSPVKNKELVRLETGLGVASRSEFREKFGQEYVLRDCCAYMWSTPQVNHDGRVLGCPINYWDDYGNAHEEGLAEVLNGEKMSYARSMLLGQVEEREDIPCVRCKAYKQMKATGAWLTKEEIQGKPVKARWQVGLENLAGRSAPTSQLYSFGERAAQALSRAFEEDGLGGVARKTGSALAARIGGGRPPRLSSRVLSLTQPIEGGPGEGWRPLYFFEGRSRAVRHFSVHMSELKQGHCPHPPHRHPEEEILLLLRGQVEIPLPDLPANGETRQIRLNPGEFVYYPAHFAHTITTISEEPARYLMFKWRDQDRGVRDRLPHGRYHASPDGEGRLEAEGFRTRHLFGGPTDWLERLACHTTTLSPGAGYPPHADPYDVAIVLLEGEVRTLGQSVGPGSLILYAAGEPHGMSNSGEHPAEYIVFEFNGRDSLGTKLTDPTRWGRKLKSLVGAARPSLF